MVTRAYPPNIKMKNASLLRCGPLASGDRDIYCDRQSGKDFDRPNYQRLLLRLQAGDVFVVKSIDRLGRNYNEILYQWRLLTNVWSSLDGSTKKAASPSGRCSSTQNM